MCQISISRVIIHTAVPSKFHKFAVRIGLGSVQVASCGQQHVRYTCPLKTLLQPVLHSQCIDATGPREAPNSERSGERLHQRSCHPKQFQRTIKLPQQGRQLSKQVAPLSINISRTFGLRISSNAWPPMQFYCKHLLRHWFFLSSERHESKEAKNLCSLLGQRCSYFALTIVPKASSVVD